MILTLQGPDREILSIENIINFLSIKNILNRGIKDRASQTKCTLFLVVKKGGENWRGLRTRVLAIG